MLDLHRLCDFCIRAGMKGSKIELSFQPTQKFAKKVNQKFLFVRNFLSLKMVNSKSNQLLLQNRTTAEEEKPKMVLYSYLTK